MSSSSRRAYSLRTRKRPAGAEQQDDDSASPASGSHQDDDDDQQAGAGGSSASSDESDDEDDSEDDWSEASEQRVKSKFGKGRGKGKRKRPVKQKQQSCTVIQQRERSPLPLPYPRRFVPSKDDKQPPTPLPIPGDQAEVTPPQRLPYKPTQSFSNVPLQRPAPEPISAASQNSPETPAPPPSTCGPAKRAPPRPFPSLFVSPPTPALWYLHSRIGEVLNAARLEGTRDESLQMASHAAVETALAGLPTREQQVAMGLIMNRYSTFLTSPSISLPIYPITPPKVSLFLSRILPTPLGTQLLTLFPQPSANPLPLANGIDRDIFPLGPGEGDRVSAELVKCWIDALGFAQGISAPVWRGLISLESQRPVGGDLAVLEVCRGVESVRTMLPVVKDASGEMGRPEKKKAKWTKGGKQVEAPVKLNSPPRINVSREISNARDLSPSDLPAEMFGNESQVSQGAFSAADLHTALSINGAPTPAIAFAPRGPFSLPNAHSSIITTSSHTNGTTAAPVAGKEGESDGLDILVASPIALSPTISLSAAPEVTETDLVPPQTTTKTPRRSSRNHGDSTAASEPATNTTARHDSTSLRAATTRETLPLINGAKQDKQDLSVSSRTRSRSISVGAGVVTVAAEKEETKESPSVGRRRSPRKLGGDGGGSGKEEGEESAQAPNSEREKEVESEVEAVRARKEGKAGQKRVKNGEILVAGDGGEGGGKKEEENRASKVSNSAEEQPLDPATNASGKDAEVASSALDAATEIPPPLSNAEIEAALAAVNRFAPPAPISDVTPSAPSVHPSSSQMQLQHHLSVSSSLGISRPPLGANRGRADPRSSVPIPLEIPRGIPGFGNGEVSPSSWIHRPHAQLQHHSRQAFVDPYAGFDLPHQTPSRYGAEYTYHSQSQQFLSHGYPRGYSWDGFPPPNQQLPGYYSRAPSSQDYSSSHSPSFNRFSQSPSPYHQQQPYSPHQPHPQQYPRHTFRSQHLPTSSHSPGWPISAGPPPLTLSQSQHQSHVQPPYPTPGTASWTGGAPQPQGGSAFGSGMGGVPMMRGNGGPPPGATSSIPGGLGGEGISILDGGGAGEGGATGLEFSAGADSSVAGDGRRMSAESSRAGTPQHPGMASGWHPLD